jgi:hypothetical protein
MRTYAARIEDGIVTQVIVGTPEWAADRLGGTWLPSDTKVGIGWEQFEDGLRPPSPYPSWTWNNGWHPPTPAPEGDWMWDEPSGTWILAEF